MIVKAESGLGSSDGLFNLQDWGSTDLRTPVAVDKANIPEDLNFHQLCCKNLKSG